MVSLLGQTTYYIFSLYVFLGTIACCIGLGVLEPTPLGEKADPFATPLEILPEWYFFPTFNLLRVIPNKFLEYSQWQRYH